MVTREYRCKCGYKIEERISIHEDPRKECPNCKRELKQIYGSQNDVYLFNYGGGARTQRFQ